MFEIFPIKVVGIIIDVVGKAPARDGTSCLEHLKSSLIPSIAKLETDDLVYVYSLYGDLKMFETSGQAVAAISDYHTEKLEPHRAFEECFFLVTQYDNASTAIFFITDCYNGKSDGLIQQVLQVNQERQTGCKFFTYGIGRCYNSSLSSLGTIFRHLDDASDVAAVFAKDLFS